VTKLAVIIPTVGRKAVVRRLLQHLESQTRLPDEVVVSAPDDSHVEWYYSRKFRTSYVFGKRGLTAQRNRGLDHVRDQFDVVTFFDDDFLATDTYLATVSAELEAHPDWVIVMGYILRDGAHEGGFSFDKGLALLRAYEADHAIPPRITVHVGANGSNMSIRSRCIGKLRFDERLVLHGWQEDIDFTSQLRPHGRIMGLTVLAGVHLGIRNGRSNGTRFGYTQVMNPLYLVRKGTVPLRFACRQISRNVAANIAKSIMPEDHIDRRGRLKGNLMAALHALSGRIEPEYVLKIHAPRKSS
jgi:glycosyltransferase involved in cell wall biosynthesis